MPPPIPEPPPTGIHKDSIRKDSLRRVREQDYRADSIWLAKTRAMAIGKIRSFRCVDSVHYACKSYHFEKGPLISPEAIHCLLYYPNRDGYFGTYEVLELEGDSWKQLLSLETGISTQGVLFKDMNGDGYKDFVAETYGTTGSGEVNGNEVYLYNPRKHHLDYIEGLGRNPHFYPDEGIVTCYYNPASVWDAEKYHLNWNKLELLEEVEVELRGMLPGTEKLHCVRKIYRYQKGNRYLFKQDRVCDFPPEYKAYKPLK